MESNGSNVRAFNTFWLFPSCFCNHLIAFHIIFVSWYKGAATREKKFINGKYEAKPRNWRICVKIWGVARSINDEIVLGFGRSCPPRIRYLRMNFCFKIPTFIDITG